MPILQTLARRIRLLVARPAFERDLDDEMRFHLEMQTRKNIERGLSPSEARALAEREFGRVERYKDEVRDVRGATWMDDIVRDLRISFRALRRTPGFTVIAVLCLALGIGANAAIFSVVNAVLLRPLPYPEPERLLRVYEGMKGPAAWTGSVSGANFRDWQSESSDVVQMMAYGWASMNLAEGGEAERVVALRGTAEFFEVLGARPIVGRTFQPGDDHPGAERVVVLGEGLWRRRFDGAADAVGRSVRFDGVPYTIIGVMPARFSFPAGGRTEVWVPLVLTEQELANSRGNHAYSVVARLRPGVSTEQATARLVDVAARIERAYPDVQANRSVVVRPLVDTVVGRVRPALLILFGAVALVLLIACANVANLLLARAATRRHEMAVRVALGATGGRLVRQLLVESLVLALGGAALGALLAHAGLRALGTLAAAALPRASMIGIDPAVFLFLLAIATLSGIAFGLVPAMQAARTDVREHLMGSAVKSTAGGSQQRLRSSLVVAEIALSLLLLVGAGLLLRAFLALSGTPTGLDPGNVLTAHVALSSAKYRGIEEVDRLLRPVLREVRSVPGVRTAGWISMLPIQEAWTNAPFSVVGQPPLPIDQQPIAEIRVASPQLFASLGVRITRGRDFTEQDGVDSAAPPPIIVNETLVRRFLPRGDPIGMQLNRGDQRSYTIVGVVHDIRQAGLDRPPLPEMYSPYSAGGWPDMVLVVRTSVPPASVTDAVRAAVRRVDAEQPLFRISTMEEVISASLADRRLYLSLLGILAAVALVLSASGLYGVVTYVVARRTREIGIRMALGARARDVMTMVLRQGAWLTGAGIGLGLLGSLALTRLLANMLYGVSPRDPVTFALLAALLAAVAMLATWLPARRAARVDPMLAIRSE